MKQLRASFIHLSCLLLGGLWLTGCEEEKPQESPVAQTAPSTQPAAATVQPREEPAEPPKAERPRDVPRDLTPERRSAVEKAHPEGKGFLVASELEAQLQKDKKLSAKPAALKAFDKLAKGKWVLFVGTLVNPTETGFDLAVSYTPLAPNDPMGISRQFFTVTFSQIEGYDPAGFKSGNTVAVLAKYSGDAAAGPGFELVADDSWK